MERMLMEYLVNSVWQAPVLAGGAWLCLRAGKPGPRAQHGVWVAALALMVAMPLLSLRGVGADVVVAPAAAPDPVVAEMRMEQPAMVESVAPTASLDLPSAAESETSSSVVNGPVSAKKTGRWLQMREVRLGPLATRWLVGLYLAAIGFAMMRLLWSWIGARRMVAEAAPAALSERESALLDACCERLRVRRPRVLVSAKTAGPLVVGVLRPALLLPEKFAQRTQEAAWDGAARELEAVWWHELAHVRRRDYLANLVCRVWALPVAYHPATHVVERRVRQTREMVCDRMAAEEMQSPVRYARCLVGLAQRMQDGGAMAKQMQGVGLFDGGVLEERVVELIGKKVVESFRMRMVRVGCGLAMLAAVLGAAAMFQVTPTMAEDAVAGAASIAPSLTMAPASAVESAPVVETAERIPSATVKAAVEIQVAAQSAVAGSNVRPLGNDAVYQRWLDQDVVWIITPEEREAFLRLPNDEERDQFIESFWGRRNPTPGAVENSFKEEHYQRIAYANEHFSGGEPGWKTDRGRTYIVYGKPDSVLASPTGVNGQGHPTEIWRYRSLPGSGHETTMRFVDDCDCGEYRLQAPSKDIVYVLPIGEPRLFMVRDSNLVFKPKVMMQTSPVISASPSTQAPEGIPVEPVAPVQTSPFPRHKIVVLPIAPQTLIAPKTSLQPGMPIEKVWQGASGVFPELTKEQNLQLSEAMQELSKTKEQMAHAQSELQKLNSPEFRKQFEEAQRQTKDAMEKLNSPEFKQKMAHAQSELQKLNSQEFREKFKEMQRRVQDTVQEMNSAEFQQRLADAQKDAANRNGPELQKQIAEMRVARLKQQLEDAQKDLDRLKSSEEKKVDGSGAGTKQPMESR